MSLNRPKLLFIVFASSLCLWESYAASPGLTKRAPHIDGCTLEQTQALHSGVTQAINMLHNASTRLVDVSNNLKHDAPARIEQWEPLRATALRTFASIMDATLDSSGIPASFHLDPDATQLKMEASANRMQSVARRAYNMAKNLENYVHGGRGTTLEILCGLRWLSLTDNHGEVSEHPNFRGFDSRTSVSRRYDNARRWVYLPFGHFPTDRYADGLNSGDSGTRKQPIPVAYEFSGMAGPFSSVVAVDPAKFQDWDLSKRPLLDLDVLRNPTPEKLRGTRAYVLEEVVRYYISVQLINVLSRLVMLTGGEPFVDLPCDGTAEQDHTHSDDLEPGEFSWRCVLFLAKTPHQALKSAKNFMFLVMALYLDNGDYSIGRRQTPLPYKDSPLPVKQDNPTLQNKRKKDKQAEIEFEAQGGLRSGKRYRQTFTDALPAIADEGTADFQHSTGQEEPQDQSMNTSNDVQSIPRVQEVWPVGTVPVDEDISPGGSASPTELLPDEWLFSDLFPSDDSGLAQVEQSDPQESGNQDESSSWQAEVADWFANSDFPPAVREECQDIIGPSRPQTSPEVNLDFVPGVQPQSQQQPPARPPTPPEVNLNFVPGVQAQSQPPARPPAPPEVNLNFVPGVQPQPQPQPRPPARPPAPPEARPQAPPEVMPGWPPALNRLISGGVHNVRSQLDFLLHLAEQQRDARLMHCLQIARFSLHGPIPARAAHSVLHNPQGLPQQAAHGAPQQPPHLPVPFTSQGYDARTTNRMNAQLGQAAQYANPRLWQTYMNGRAGRQGQPARYPHAAQRGRLGRGHGAYNGIPAQPVANMIPPYPAQSPTSHTGLDPSTEDWMRQVPDDPQIPPRVIPAPVPQASVQQTPPRNYFELPNYDDWLVTPPSPQNAQSVVQSSHQSQSSSEGQSARINPESPYQDDMFQGMATTHETPANLGDPQDFNSPHP